MASARWKGREIKCQNNMRQAGLLLQTYAVANKDYLPYQGEVPHPMYVPGFGPIMMGHPTANSIISGRWSFFFPDEWGGYRQWNPALRCPMQPVYKGEEGINMWESDRPTPTFDLSFALFNRADTMRPDSKPEDYKIGPNKLGDAIYPSNKVLLFEFPGFCLRAPEGREMAYAIGKCFLWETSTLTIDGAVTRFAAKNAVDFKTRGEAYYTVNGIRGRDIPGR